MTAAKLLAAGTVAYENWWRTHHNIPAIANPSDWRWVLENRFSIAIRKHSGFLQIFEDVTHAAH